MIGATKSLAPHIKSQASKGKTIVLATGFFDLLHQEHINFLNEASKLGDILVVGVESDQRAKQLKGPNRPIIPQSKRSQTLNNLEVVDYVINLPPSFFKASERENLIKEIKPNILAVSQRSPKIDNKKKLIEKYHGKLIVTHKHNPNISTTITLRNIKKS